MSAVCLSSWAGAAASTSGGSACRAAAAAAIGRLPRRTAGRDRGRGASPTTALALPAENTAAVVHDAGPKLPARGQEEQDRLVEDLMAFLREDLQHLFDDEGIDASKYEPHVVFEDPITYYNGIQGYLFNIAFLRKVFSPTFTLHDVRRTGPLELTTRWTMRMSLALARGRPLRQLWDPTLTFTGTSVMGINPETGRFNRHADTWDAVRQQRYFSLEAFVHMLWQVGDLRQGPEVPGQYEVLLKRRQYEVRKYSQLPEGATEYDGAEGGKAAGAASASSGSMYAVADFTGVAREQAAAEAQRVLRVALLEAGLQPAGRRWLLAPGGGKAGPTNPLRWRNEVLIPLQAFQLW